MHAQLSNIKFNVDCKSDSDEDDWKIQTRKQSIQFEVNSFQIRLSNRFSHFPEDEQTNEVSNFITEAKETTEKVKFVKPRSKEGFVKKQIISLKLFKLKNRYSVLQDLREEETEMINLDASNKRKCKYCNFKTWCYLNRKLCKAKGSTCNKCLGSSHFPKSKSCSKSRKEQYRRKSYQRKIKYECETLRMFLKRKQYHIRGQQIPFDELLTKTNSKKGNKIVIKDDNLFNNIGLVIAHIEFLEQKMKIQEKVKQLSFGHKFLLQLYILINLGNWSIQEYLTEVQEDSSEDGLVKENVVKLNEECGNNGEENQTQFLHGKIQESRRLIVKYTNELQCALENETNNQDVFSNSDNECPDSNCVMSCDTFDTEYIANRDFCTIPQLDGSADMNPVSNVLGGINCEGNMASTIVNLFRCLEDTWILFKNHTLCSKPLSSTISRCLFCHLRSICLRVNKVKRRTCIKAVEIDAQRNSFPEDEQLFQNFPQCIAEIMVIFTSYDVGFKEATLSLEISCLNSEHDENGAMQPLKKDGNTFSTPDQLAAKLKSFIETSHSQNLPCEYPRIDMKQKTVLLFIFQENVDYHISKHLIFEGNEYEVCAYASVEIGNSIKTTFKFKDFVKASTEIS